MPSWGPAHSKNQFSSFLPDMINCQIKAETFDAHVCTQMCTYTENACTHVLNNTSGQDTDGFLELGI